MPDAGTTKGPPLPLEEWGEESMVKYKHSPGLGPGIFEGMKKADLAMTSTIEYGTRVGIYRLMDNLG